MAESMTFGILTVSDTCFHGTKKDLSGPRLESLVSATFHTAQIVKTTIVPDEIDSITNTLKLWVNQSVDIVLTTGGTGFAPRDVTPEATRKVIEREAPALSHAITAASLQKTPMAMLSRAVCGIAKRTIIVNMPGSEKAVVECFDAIKAVLPHAASVVKDESLKVTKLHDEMKIRSKVVLKPSALRNRFSPFKMIDVSEALSIFRNVTEVEVVEKSVNDALFHVTREEVFSVDPLPPFPASMKDGYAVIAADGAGVRRIRDAIAAGDCPQNFALLPGEAVRINTGAPLPNAADAVIQVEDTVVVESTKDGEELKVEMKTVPRVGQDIRPIGSDIPAKSKILGSKVMITPGLVGVLAAVGCETIKVSRKPSIGIISTGNELQSPTETLQPGHIRDSNKAALIALLKEHHFQADDCGIAKDNPDDVLRKLTNALENHDFIITTGGVSMGEYDVIQKVLVEDLGTCIHFGRVNMKPGKPTTFGQLTYKGRTKYVFALPGNPVSAMVTAIVFLLPALRTAEGRSEPRQMKLRLGEDYKLDTRPEYARAFVSHENDGLTAYTTGNQVSSRMLSFFNADVLIALPGSTVECPVIKKGAFVDAIRINQFF